MAMHCQKQIQLSTLYTDPIVIVNINTLWFYECAQKFDNSWLMKKKLEKMNDKALEKMLSIYYWIFYFLLESITLSMWFIYVLFFFFFQMLKIRTEFSHPGSRIQKQS